MANKDIEPILINISEIVIKHWEDVIKGHHMQCDGVMLNGMPCQYQVKIQPTAGDGYIIKETLTGRNGVGAGSYEWCISTLGGEMSLIWGESDNYPLQDSRIFYELERLFARLEMLNSPLATKFDTLPVPSADPIQAKKAHSGGSLFFSPYIMGGIAAFLLVFLNILFIYEINSSVTELVNPISNTENTLTDFTTKIEQLERISDSLTRDAEIEKENFILSRKSFVEDIRKEAETVWRGVPAVYTAYYRISDRMEGAESFEQLVHLNSILPTNSLQARLYLNTDPAYGQALSRYTPLFSMIDIPVQVRGSEPNGEDFVISSGFSLMRDLSLGTGGVNTKMAHEALDIINVKNISEITSDGRLVRHSAQPGAVVSSVEGEVILKGTTGVFGNHVEVKHELNSEVLRGYPYATSWSTFYAHMSDFASPEIGDRVALHEELGSIGTTGLSTGPHLHFEVRIYHAGGKYPSIHGVSNRYDRVVPFFAEGQKIVYDPALLEEKTGEEFTPVEPPPVETETAPIEETPVETEATTVEETVSVEESIESEEELE